MLTAVPNHNLTLITPTIRRKPLHELNGWIFTNNFSLQHYTNRFFTIIGYSNIDTDRNLILYDQNEIGYLFTAYISSTADPLDDLFFCSLKFEPGNLPYYQLSPVIQKTFSNLSAVHGGMRFSPDILKKYILKLQYSLLHTEQSNSFLHKKNLNTLALVSEDFYDFTADNNSSITLTLRQLLRLALLDSCIHIDLRSCILPHLFSVYFLISDKVVEPKFTKTYLSLLQRSTYYSLFNQQTWRSSFIDSFSSYDNLTVTNDSESALLSQEVLGFNIECGNREVSSWDQPLLSYPDSHFTLIYCLLSEVPHVLLSLNIGPGTRNEAELTPSFVDTTDRLTVHLSSFPSHRTVHRSFQTEEGGRFFQRKNSHSLVCVDSFDLPEDLKSDLFWVNLYDLSLILHHTHLCSIELRSILFVFLAHLLVSK